MLIVAIRTFVLYIIVLIAVSIMGKSELSKMSPFQFVIVFMIAELAAMPIDDPSTSLINGVMAIFTLMLLQVLISFFSIKSEKIKNLVSGKPSILIEKGKLNIKELKKLRITSTDLLEQLRLANCPSLSDVEYAIMEANGQLTVIPKADQKPLTPKDMGLTVNNGLLPMVVVSDGTVYNKNLLAAGVPEELFRQKLRDSGISSYKDIFLAFYDENKSFHVYLYSDNAIPFASEVKI